MTPIAKNLRSWVIHKRSIFLLPQCSRPVGRACTQDLHSHPTTKRNAHAEYVNTEGWIIKIKESLQLRLWNFNICIEKVEAKFCPCKMLIGGDDISNDAITLGTRFSMFVNICPRFHVALICENSIAQSKGSPREIGGGIQIPQMLLQAFLPSFAPPSELSRELDYSTNSGASTSQLRLGI